MAAPKQPPKSRKLPSGWEKRIDYTTDKAYYVDHNTKTTHWHLPPPQNSLPKTPPNNLINKQPSNHSSNISKFDLNNTSKSPRRPKHGRASTYGSLQSTTLQWNINTEMCNLQTISDIPNPKLIRKQSKPLIRKKSKPYSKDTIDTRRKIPHAPPAHLKKTPSLRNTISIKPPPTYTKKHIPNNAIPPPPPRSIPMPPKREMGNKTHKIAPIRQANPFKMDSNQINNIKLKKDIIVPPPPHKGALPPAGAITPTHVERMTDTNTLPQLNPFANTEPLMINNNNNNNSIDNIHRNTINTMAINKLANELPDIKRKPKPSTPENMSSIHKKQGREHARTMTATTFANASKWGSKTPIITTAKFGKYKNKLTYKYTKNKKKLKEKYKEKKTSIKKDIKEYRKKRKESNMDIHNDNEEFEYSISHTIESSIMSNPLSPHKGDINDVDAKFDYDNESENEQNDIKQEPEYYSLKEIVQLVTAPKVRGTQDQTVLLHTYCIYSSRQELLEVIFNRLLSSSTDTQTQIKVLSLLRTWLKTENDFKHVYEHNFKKKQESIKAIELNAITATGTGNIPTINLSDLSPSPSVPDPPLTKMEQHTSAAHINNNDNNNNNDLNPINDNEEIDIFNLDKQPQFIKRHRIEYAEDYTFELSPFAIYFRNELISHTQNSELLTKLCQPILSQLSINKRESNNIRDRTLSFADAPTPKIPKIKDTKDLDLNKISPIEIARQICLLEYNIFKLIKSEEFLKQKSTKQKKMEQILKSKDIISNNSSHNLSEETLTKELKDLQRNKDDKLQKQSTQPNIDKMTNWFNRLVIWTQIEILYERDSNKRVKVLINILKICDSLEKYNNISSLCAIRAGLCSAPIHRLRKTWDNISKKGKDIKSNIDKLFKLGNGQKNLRDRVAIISQPAIPHLGLFLGDIVFIHDGNETLKNNKINWSKMNLLADRINWISMFQQSPFIFQTVDCIQEYLKSKMKILPEDFLYKLSREVEPPEKKK